MSSSTKSMVTVAQEALELGNKQFELYSHPSSPQKFTQAQLFACLVVKTFLNFDYRRMEKYLHESKELQALLSLKKVPHFTTLQKACERLLRKYSIASLLACTVNRYLETKKKQFNFNFC